MRGNLNELMKQAQAMQENMQKAQAEIGSIEVVGEAGGGMVKVTMSGRHEVKRVQIEPAVSGEDREMLEDLIAAATNDAVHKVEARADGVAIECSGSYRGRYFVLMGPLWPVDGIGPEQLGVRELEAILAQGGVRELILATNSTVEGEATAHFLSGLAARRGIRASRIAHGVPVGGELEYVDGGTLAHALAGRQSVS